MALRPTSPGSALSDEQLVELYRSASGSAGAGSKAFESLVERYREELFHFLIRFTGNRAAAEDLFQEAFLQVHLSAETFDTSKRFKPWLFTIAANKARDYLRRNSRRQAAALSSPVSEGDEGGTEFLDLLEADLPLPVEHLAEAETRERVRGVVQEMPTHLREVLLLAYFHQFAYKDIAEMAGVPLGTVKSRLHAAVATFASMWKHRYGSTPPGAGGGAGEDEE
jgi:RNA polymerase sigma-70 factor (ECF subfamily)